VFINILEILKSLNNARHVIILCHFNLFVSALFNEEAYLT